MGLEQNLKSYKLVLGKSEYYKRISDNFVQDYHQLLGEREVNSRWGWCPNDMLGFQILWDY